MQDLSILSFRDCHIEYEQWKEKETRLGVDKVKPKGWFKFFLTDK